MNQSHLAHMTYKICAYWSVWGGKFMLIGTEATRRAGKNNKNKIKTADDDLHLWARMLRLISSQRQQGRDSNHSGFKRRGGMRRGGVKERRGEKEDSPELTNHSAHSWIHETAGLWVRLCLTSLIAFVSDSRTSSVKPERRRSHGGHGDLWSPVICLIQR